MKSRRLRYGLAALVFLLAFSLLLVSLLPEPRVQQVLPMPPILLPTPTPTTTTTTSLLEMVGRVA